MHHHRWIPLLLLLLAAAGALGAEPLTVSATPARVQSLAPILPEVTAAVFGPNENPACPEGRLAFAAGRFVRLTGLAGEDVFVETAQGLEFKVKVIDLNLLTGEPDSDPIWDSHLTRVGNDLVHAVMGFTFKELSCMAETSNCKAPCVAMNVVENGALTAKCRPQWWDSFTAYPHDAHGPKPGARAAIWVFRSSDCGVNWSFTGKVDAATLRVKDPEGKTTTGFCGVPRLREEGVACKDPKKTDIENCPDSVEQVAIKKRAEVGGWDGPYLGADPETGRLVVSTLCAFGTGVTKTAAAGVTDVTGLLENNDLRHHIFVVSDDDGKTWKSKASLPQPDKEKPSLGIWRGAVMPLGEDVWAFAYGEGGGEVGKVWTCPGSVDG